MASNGLKYYTSYLQSHEERYAKFRDEAYKELIMEQELDAEYRKALRDREKVLTDAIAKLKAGKGSPDILEILKAEKATVDSRTSALDEARDARLRIQESLKGELTVPQGAQTKLGEASNALATSGGLIADPKGIQAFIEGQIVDVSSAVKGGTRSAASTAQQLWKGIKSDSSWNKLSADQRIALEDKVTSQFGLDTVNIGGVSGSGLLDTPQDVLLKKEEELLLKREGGAYGVKSYDAILAELKALREGGASPEAIAAKQAELDESLAPLEGALAGVQEALTKPSAQRFPPSEAEVRKRAAEKYGFEAPKFMKQQFERDMLGDDTDKLLHYDAIQAAKEGRIGKDDDVYRQALVATQQEVPLGASKAAERKRIIDLATAYAGDDTSLRDKYLIAYHQIQLEKKQARTAPSKELPEPLRIDVDMEPTKDSFPKTGGIKTDAEGYFTTKGGERVYVPPLFRERELRQPAPYPPELPSLEEDEFRETLTPGQKFYEKRIQPLEKMSMKDLFNLEG